MFCACGVWVSSAGLLGAAEWRSRSERVQAVVVDRTGRAGLVRASGPADRRWKAAPIVTVNARSSPAVARSGGRRPATVGARLAPSVCLTYRCWAWEEARSAGRDFGLAGGFRMCKDA